jgi:hypothetical protein
MSEHLHSQEEAFLLAIDFISKGFDFSIVALSNLKKEKDSSRRMKSFFHIHMPNRLLEKKKPMSFVLLCRK